MSDVFVIKVYGINEIILVVEDSLDYHQMQSCFVLKWWDVVFIDF